ncbi:MAG: PqqD family peptide modification chaperone [Cyanobacteria bacterium P01_D01_bin.56]
MLTELLEISPRSIVSPMPEQVSSELNGEVVILNLTSGVYYGLNEVGARIWELIQQPRSVEQIYSILLDEYEVAPDACQQELFNLLQGLKNACLIEVSDATAV